MLPARIAENTN